MPVRLGIVDDHALFVGSLVSLFDGNPDFRVVLTAHGGREMQEKLKNKKSIPDIMLVDVNMPGMNGFETTLWLKKEYPAIRTVALSMRDDDIAIINMIGAGCCSYLTKDINPGEFEKALMAIHATGHYSGDVNSSHSSQLIMTAKEMEALRITGKEMEFLKLACSNLTYREIAIEMNQSRRTVETYSEHLFAKFKVVSRIELCLEAIRLGLVEYRKR